ncbi:hypothetical protein L1887_06178 [Cichorium endivia]|nr:hypothetical protein L1887_06178 [Cichorium endivia]
MPENGIVNIDWALITFLCLVIFILCLLYLVTTGRHLFPNNVIIRWLNHTPLAAKLLKSIPKLMYSGESMAEKFSDCPICLTEFVDGDEIRVLPVCSHCFHVTRTLATISSWSGEDLVLINNASICMHNVPKSGSLQNFFNCGSHCSQTYLIDSTGDNSQNKHNY